MLCFRMLLNIAESQSCNYYIILTQSTMKKQACLVAIAVAFSISPVQAKKGWSGPNLHDISINEVHSQAYSPLHSTSFPCLSRVSMRNVIPPSSTAILAQYRSPYIVVPNTYYPKNVILYDIITPNNDPRVKSCTSKYAKLFSCGSDSQSNCWYYSCT